MEWIRSLNAAIGKPQHVIFQSWLGPSANGVHEVPINLPENDPSVSSHTRLIIEGLDVFGQAVPTQASPTRRPPPSHQPTVAASPATAPTFTTAWEFERNGDTEGWVAWNQLYAMRARSGRLMAESAGGDPYMASPALAMDAQSFPIIQIRMSVSSGSTAQVFFITDADTEYDEAKSQRFSITGHRQFHIYTIDMSTAPGWTGTITQLRLDPVDTQGAIDIDYIRLLMP